MDSSGRKLIKNLFRENASDIKALSAKMDALARRMDVLITKVDAIYEDLQPKVLDKPAIKKPGAEP